MSPEHQVQLWVLGENTGSEFQLRMVQELGDRSVKIHFLEKRHKRDRVRCVARLRRLLRRERPDVVNTHLEYVGALVALAGVFLQVRQVQTIHSVAISSKLVLKTLAARNVHFVAISRTLMDHYARELSLALARFTLILNGTDLSQFAHRERTPGPVLNLLSVGRLETPKDFATLVRAAGLVRAQTDRPFVVTIHGQGSLRPELERLVAEQGLEQVVQFPGHSNAIPEIMRAADIYVVSSRWEGLSIALLEAMSSGMPLIATGVGGNGEIVVDGVNGFLVEKENPAAIAGAMMKFIGDPELITRFSRAQIELRKEFDIDTCVRKYVSMYGSLPPAGA